MIDLFEERTNRIGFEREINEIHIEFSKFPFSKKIITANILKGFERKKKEWKTEKLGSPEEIHELNSSL